MGYVRKTSGEKLADGLPKVCRIEPAKLRRWGLKAGATMVIPAPAEVAALMKRVPAEGHAVMKRGARMFVMGFEACVVRLG